MLRLTGVPMPRREIRHIALMQDSLVFSDRGGHFPLPGTDAPVVIFSSPNGYAIKYAGTDSDVHELADGRPVLLGETRFTINPICLS